MRGFALLGVLAWGAAVAAAAALPEVPQEAVAELGVTSGVPQLNGFVFIEGQYVSPPYTVTRRGNGIFINRQQVEQPVSWVALGGKPEPLKRAVDADGDFEEVAPAGQGLAAPEPAPEPAALPAAEPMPPAAEGMEAPAGEAEAEAPAPAPAPAAAPRVVKSIDDLFSDDEPAVAAPAPVVAAPAVRSPQELRRVREEVKLALDSKRKAYEAALEQGEIFFFGQGHGKVNGTYGTARTLLGVLPGALRQAQSPQELMQRLNQGGVYFLDLALCSALYRHRLVFPQLEERLKRIELQEQAEAARKSQAAR